MGCPQAIADKTGGRPHSGRFLRLTSMYTRSLKLAIIFRKLLAIDVGELDIYRNGSGVVVLQVLMGYQGFRGR
jgi:hypothetical protein